MTTESTELWLAQQVMKRKQNRPVADQDEGFGGFFKNSRKPKRLDKRKKDMKRKDRAHDGWN